MGFPIGPSTQIRHLVLQVHYINIDSLPNEGDSSGVYLTYTTLRMKREAAMLSLHVGTKLPPRTVTFQDAACRIGEDKVRCLLRNGPEKVDLVDLVRFVGCVSASPAATTDPRRRRD